MSISSSVPRPFIAFCRFSQSKSTKIHSMALISLLYSTSLNIKISIGYQCSLLLRISNKTLRKETFRLIYHRFFRIDPRCMIFLMHGFFRMSWWCGRFGWLIFCFTHVRRCQCAFWWTNVMRWSTNWCRFLIGWSFTRCFSKGC